MNQNSSIAAFYLLTKGLNTAGRKKRRRARSLVGYDVALTRRRS
jgi:hypothetical protein